MGNFDKLNVMAERHNVTIDEVFDRLGCFYETIRLKRESLGLGDIPGLEELRKNDRDSVLNSYLFVFLFKEDKLNILSIRESDSGRIGRYYTILFTSTEPPYKEYKLYVLDDIFDDDLWGDIVTYYLIQEIILYQKSEMEKKTEEILNVFRAVSDKTARKIFAYKTKKRYNEYIKEDRNKNNCDVIENLCLLFKSLDKDMIHIKFKNEKTGYINVDTRSVFVDGGTLTKRWPYWIGALRAEYDENLEYMTDRGFDMASYCDDNNEWHSFEI